MSAGVVNRGHISHPSSRDAVALASFNAFAVATSACVTTTVKLNAMAAKTAKTRQTKIENTMKLNTPQFWHATRRKINHSDFNEVVTIGYFTGEHTDVLTFLEAAGENRGQFRLEELKFRHITAETIAAFRDAKANLEAAESALRIAKNGVVE